MSVNVIPYVPQFYVKLPKLAEVGTAWNGVDRILYDIVNRFNVKQGIALEFGVEFGYSTSALANVFKQVIGIDTFTGDIHSSIRVDHFKETEQRLKVFWPNIVLFQMDFQTWIGFDDRQYDLIHVDIVHNFEETYDAGMWAVEHAPVVIFHDTEAFPKVKDAVMAIAEDKGRTFYNYGRCPESQHGLGILVKE